MTDMTRKILIPLYLPPPGAAAGDADYSTALPTQPQPFPAPNRRASGGISDANDAAV